MRENYDFSKGVKNPYADKLKKGYTVTVHYDFSQNSDNKEQSEKRDSSDDSHSCSTGVNSAP